MALESSWTQEREATLARLWSEGNSSRDIALILGGVTRNGVIGKIHRLGLSTPTTKKAAPKREKRSTANTGGHHIIYRLERADRNGSLRLRQTIQREEYKLRCVEIECTTTFDDVTGCRYPSGDGPYLFCNGTLKEGRKDYCVAHHALCWVPPAPVRDKAPLREVA